MACWYCIASEVMHIDQFEMFSHSRMSAGRVPGGWSSNRESATGLFGVYARNDEQQQFNLKYTSNGQMVRNF